MLAMVIPTRPLFYEEPYQQQFTAHVLAVSELGVALDQTLFYPTGGGQPGDKGCFLLPEGCEVAVVGAQRDSLIPSIIWHQLAGGSSAISVGMKLQGCLDWKHRYQHMRMHTCLHLLCSIVDAPVTGCSIATDKGRLDFDLPESSFDKEHITHRLNELVGAALPVTTHMYPADKYSNTSEITHTSAVSSPAMLGMVRVVDISGLDTQPCGGTHVLNTSEVGKVICAKIEKKGRHNRRVTLRFA